MNKPLETKIVDGELVISIGIHALCHQVEHGLTVNEEADFKIIDTERFSEEILGELLAEAEDGTTPIHVLFDNACNAAIDNGARGVELVEYDEST